MTQIDIDFVKTKFEYPELTKIHGRPTYESLKIIKDELKTNAGSITSSLAGGTSGHLGIVLTLPEMTLVTPVLYVRPLQPAPLLYQQDQDFPTYNVNLPEIYIRKKSMYLTRLKM